MAQEYIDKKVDVWLLTGYLGAGKTTTVNALLRREQFAGRKLALIINEFGKMSIDGRLIDPGDYEKYEINKGSIFCICTKTEFISAFEQIREHRVDTVVIEATGIAEISDIEQLLNERVLKGVFQIRANICIVDGIHFIKTAAFLKTAVSQVQSADGLVINKTDCLNEIDVEQLKEIIDQMNPSALKATSEFGNITSEYLAALKHCRRAQPLFNSPPIEIPNIYVQSSKPVKRAEFYRILDTFKVNILRLKGDVQFEDGSRFVEVVGQQVAEQDAKGTFGFPTAFTVIGWKIERRQLHQAFDNLMHT